MNAMPFANNNNNSSTMGTGNTDDANKTYDANSTNKNAFVVETDLVSSKWTITASSFSNRRRSKSNKLALSLNMSIIEDDSRNGMVPPPAGDSTRSLQASCDAACSRVNDSKHSKKFCKKSCKKFAILIQDMLDLNKCTIN